MSGPLRTLVLSDRFEDTPKGRLIPGAYWDPKSGGLVFQPGRDPAATRMAIHLFAHIEPLLEQGELDAALATPAPEGTADELLHEAHESDEASLRRRWELDQRGEGPPLTADEAARRGRRAYYQQ